MSVAGCEWKDLLQAIINLSFSFMSFWSVRGSFQEPLGNLFNALPFLKPDPDAVGQDGVTALHIAAGDGFDAIVATLLEEHADPRIKDHDGLLPIHRAAASCNMKRERRWASNSL